MTASTGQKPVARSTRRLGGVFIFAAATAVTWVVWRQAHTRPEFSAMGALAGPAFALIGIGLVLWPGYREERIARGEDIAGKQGAQLITPRWWAIIMTGMALGLAYTLGLAKGWL